MLLKSVRSGLQQRGLSQCGLDVTEGSCSGLGAHSGRI
jgi:hypothetical protein